MCTCDIPFPKAAGCVIELAEKVASGEVKVCVCVCVCVCTCMCVSGECE